MLNYIDSNFSIVVFNGVKPYTVNSEMYKRVLKSYGDGNYIKHFTDVFLFHGETIRFEIAPNIYSVFTRL